MHMPYQQLCYEVKPHITVVISMHVVVILVALLQHLQADQGLQAVAASTQDRQHTTATVAAQWLKHHVVLSASMP